MRGQTVEPELRKEIEAMLIDDILRWRVEEPYKTPEGDARLRMMARRYANGAGLDTFQHIVDGILYVVRYG